MLGRSLGNYGVVSKIGEGGMGIVYLARHATLGRKAAIKVLRPDLSSNRDVVSRFFNEARAATAVRHSGIVEVYDFGFLEDRTAYIVMEYLEGESLAARLRRGRPTIAVTLTIVRAISRALQAAHDQGIVHRDLKPDNVFLVPEPELPSGERVKLLDFGIAKLAHSVGEANHTQTGTVMGTPTYMSPEQCRGAGPVDHRADLYSLGCVAYEMLCGQPPFVADGPGVVIGRHLHIEPEPPRSHRPDIPAEVEEIVLRLLKKEPRDRYRNATDLVRAIDQLATVTPPAARPAKPVPTEFVATLPMVKEKTTLNGAASSSEVSTRNADRPRVTLLAAAVTSVIAFLVVILFFARGPHDGETATTAATGALTVEPKEHEGSARPAPPPSAAPTAPSVAPSTVSGPSGISPPSVDRTQPPPSAVDPSGGSDGTALTRSNPAASPSVPPNSIKPTAPANSSPPDTLDVATTLTTTPESSNDAARPSEVTGSRDARTASEAPKQPAAKPAAVAKPKGVARPTETPRPVETTKPTEATQGVSADPTEFPKWSDTLKPMSSGKSNDPKGGTANSTAGRTTSTAPPTNAPIAACTLPEFTPVLGAQVPDDQVLNDALSQLQRCRPMMSTKLYNDIQGRLTKELRKAYKLKEANRLKEANKLKEADRLKETQELNEAQKPKEGSAANPP